MKPDICVLYLNYGAQASYFNDWYDAIIGSKAWTSHPVNIFSFQNVQKQQKIIQNADTVIMLHSCMGDTLSYVNRIKPILQKRRGKLLSFIGNEYNSPYCRLKDKRDFLKDVQVDTVASQLTLDTATWLYHNVASMVISMPHALHTASFSPQKSFPKRPYWMGSRSFAYPISIGDLDRNRMLQSYPLWNIPSRLKNFSTTQRLNRKEWAHFLNDCRSTLSTEAGTPFIERDDETVMKIHAYLMEKGYEKKIPMRQFLQSVMHHLPYGVRQLIKNIASFLGFHVDMNHEVGDALFEEIYDLFFKDIKNTRSGKCISSRHFDAIGTKTLNIMFEGQFNGILEPKKHYLTLKKDFSNIDEITYQLDHEDFCRNITERTYDHITSHHTYDHRMHTLKEILYA